MIAEIALGRSGDIEEAQRSRTLLSRLGPSILAAYRIYGNRVSPRLRESREIFREAVNEILGREETLL
jgi:hypothetical protein